MLKTLRKKGVMKKLLWVVAIVIIISFGFFGTAYLLTDSNQRPAGEIFGKKVSLTEFDESYRRTRILAILRFGDSFSKLLPFIDLEAETWSRMILLREAKNRRIKVSNTEVVEYIGSHPFFQRDGHFDNFLYKQILHAYFRCEPREFEESVRSFLMTSKLFEQVTAPVSLNENEVREEYTQAHEKIQVNYAFFAIDQYKNGVNVSEDEIKSYYEQNKKTFRVPPSVNVAFLKIPYAEDADDTENAKNNQSEVEAKAKVIAMELLLTPDLKEIAKKYELSATETGFFSMEKPDLRLGWSPELLKKAFELEPGKFSEPIETGEGYYILQVTERRDAYVPEFAEARIDAGKALIALKSSELAKATAAESLKQIKNTLGSSEASFTQAVESLGLSVQQTPVFGRGEYIPNIGLSSAFQEAAFALHGNDTTTVSDVIPTEKGFAILNMASYEPINEDEYIKEKEKTADEILLRKRNDTFTEFMAQLRLKANLKSNLPKKSEENPGQPEDAI